MVHSLTVSQAVPHGQYPSSRGTHAYTYTNQRPQMSILSMHTQLALELEDLMSFILYKHGVICTSGNKAIHLSMHTSCTFKLNNG